MNNGTKPRTTIILLLSYFQLQIISLLVLLPSTVSSFSLSTMSGSGSGSGSGSDHPVNVKLRELGIVLKDPPAPKGNYVAAVRTGNLIHICGHIPQKEDGTLHTGTLGKELTVEDGYESAKACATNILATISKYLNGDWSKLVQVVKVVGFVQCTPEFEQQPAVINGASDFFVQVLGKNVGMHARSAVGTNALPLNIATEVECIVEIKD
jgi:enamine deaminase RidA (YjgF/YER057c/UK114 family)